MKAIRAAQEALSVFSLHDSPEDYAEAQGTLWLAHLTLADMEYKAENLSLALEACQDLSVARRKIGQLIDGIRQLSVESLAAMAQDAWQAWNVEFSAALYDLDFDKAGFDRTEPALPKLDPKEILGILPDTRDKSYEMREIIKRLVDNSEFDEYKELYGQSIVCGLARIDGWAVGIVANQTGSS